MARTVRDFVKCMKRHGRTNREVRAVALCTHWNGHPELRNAIKEARDEHGGGEVGADSPTAQEDV